MKRGRYLKLRWTSILAAAALAVFSLYPARVFAVESIMLPTQVVGNDVVSMSLPIVSDSETSVFDFILDPQGLLYSTDAVRYGGGTVEEGATLLFYNKEGDYNFSHHSDWLTVTNRSTVPVRVTITAQVTDLGDIRLVESADFAESTEPDIYLAIVDDQGNIQPLSDDGQASVSLEMDAAPENTYVFRLDEETHTYQYGMSMDPNRIDFDTYSFGLIGACNANAEWQNISVHPTITVTWCVEPIMPEQEDGFVEEESNTGDDSGDDNAPADESGNEDNEVNQDNKNDEDDQSDEDNDDKTDEIGQYDEDDENDQSDDNNDNNDNDLDDDQENDSGQGEEVEDDNLQDPVTEDTVPE